MASTSTGIISFAQTENSAGATNDSQSGPAGVVEFDSNSDAYMRPAWLVYIQKVNSHGEVPEEIYAQGITQTECKYAAISEMLYNYPQDYQTGDNSFYTDRCAVIVKQGNANYTGSVNIYKPDGNLSGAINHVYHVSGSAPSNMAMTIVSDDILLDDASVEKFRSGQWTMSDYNAAVSTVSANGMDMNTAVKNFVNHFGDIGSLSDKIIKTTEGTQQAYPDYFDTIRNSQMLDLLGVINEMCGGSYNAAIELYLSSQNRNGSDEFYIPVIIAGYVANGKNQSPPTFYSLPTYYHKTYGASTDTLFNIPKAIANKFGNYGASLASASTYEDNVHAYYESKMGGIKSGSKFFMYRVGSWWNHTYGSTSLTGIQGQAYVCMPTNFQDEMRGNLGYTYFAFGGDGNTPIPGETLGQFNITASSEQKNVTAPNTSVAALINIDLNCTTQQRQSIRDAFDNEKKEGYTTADIIVDYSYASVAGNGSSSPLIDTVFTSGATLSGGNRVTLSNMTYDKLKPYIEGSKLIQVADSGILINGATTNKYLASVTIKFPDKSYKMLAKGKKIESDTQGSDTVMWGLNNMTGMGESVHYYSSIGKAGIQDNYVEIKHNTPGHEEYEAMAGIPTTEDLYVGFGITEFMVNMDAERAESPASTRYYTYVYKADNCYGHDEPCVYSCSKNHKGGSGGCGALICTNTDPKHTHGGSCYCDKGHYTKDDFDCSDDGKWEWEWVCDCSNKPLANGSGKATYGPGYKQCIGVDGSDDGTGGTKWGCQHQEHLNTTHCGVTFTGVVEQPIDSFYYLDITDLDLCNLFDNFVQICVKCELSCKRERGRIGVNEG